VKLPPGRPNQSEINVTPLVDVFLVLLVIFMITAPVLRSAFEIGLPRASSAETRVHSGLVVELRIDGGIYLDRQPIAADKLAAEISRLRNASDSSVDSLRAVFLAADEGVPYGEVIALLDRLRLAGVIDVGLMTELPADKTD
jgi:biopolymer transport protein TolR